MPNKPAVKRLGYHQDSSENSSSSDELCTPVVSSRNEAICIFCEHHFSKDASGEERVQCLSYEEWPHSECAGTDKHIYICHLCK
mgnify:CR=1 FL=1